MTSVNVYSLISGRPYIPYVRHMITLKRGQTDKQTVPRPMHYT